MQDAETEPGPGRADPIVIDPSKFDPRRPLARELEQQVGDRFTLSAVGDCVLSRPMSHYHSVLAHMRFGRRAVKEIKLYPLDLNYGKALPESGLPCLAAPAVADRILSRLQDISRPYGTEIARATEDGASIGSINGEARCTSPAR